MEPSQFKQMVFRKPGEEGEPEMMKLEGYSVTSSDAVTSSEMTATAGS